MKELLYICNAHAGKSAVKNKIADIVDCFIKEGYHVSIHITQSRGDAAQIAASRGAGVDRIVCSGGDGTLNEVISGLMQLPEALRPIVGYIPAGTTNDYARTLHLPAQMTKAAEIAMKGEVHAVDVGRAGSNYFNYAYGFGMFTEVSYATSQELKKTLGHSAYVLEGIRSLIGTKSYAMTIRWEDQELKGRFLLGMVTNANSVAGMKGLWGEHIGLSDGVFEVTLIEEPQTLAEWPELPMKFLAKGSSDHLVYRFKTSKISFECEEVIKWVKDGEFAGSHAQVTVENISRAVRITTKK